MPLFLLFTHFLLHSYILSFSHSLIHAFLLSIHALLPCNNFPIFATYVETKSPLVLEKSRQKEEFLSLITEHQDLIRKVAAMYYKNKADQEDAFQEILVNLWKAYPTFRGESKITTWMYRVALNTVISAFRKASNRVHRNKSDIELSDELIKPSGEGISSDDIDVLHQAIDKLSDIEKAVIMLYMEEKTYDDIAEIMGMTRTNVGVKINRIKKKLQNIYKELANGY